MGYRCGPDLHAIAVGTRSEWRIDNELKLIVLNRIDAVWSTFAGFSDHLGLNAVLTKNTCGATGGGNLEAKLDELFRDRDSNFMVSLIDGYKDLPAFWEADAC